MAGLLPKRYAVAMTNHLLTLVLDYMTSDGQVISELQWRKTYKHETQLYAKVDGESKRYVFMANSSLVREIMDAGWKYMPTEMTQRYVDRF